MANNLRRFTTEADYSAATLNYPAVSWVVSGDTVHFDKSAPIVNDKVIIVSYGGTGEGYFVFYNCYGSQLNITNIIFNDVEVTPITCRTDNQYDASQVHTAIYTLSDTEVTEDVFGAELGLGAASDPSKVDMLIPSQITSIAGLPQNIWNLVVEAENPTEIAMTMSGFMGEKIYVPDASVNAYKEAYGWSSLQTYILPISEYQGNLPV